MPPPGSPGSVHPFAVEMALLLAETDVAYEPSIVLLDGRYV